MSLPYVIDGETELDSDLFNPMIDAINNGSGSWSQHLRQGIYNVLDYNAEGDGITDDTVAIQAAIDAAGAAGGGTVYFPAGRYLVSLRSGFTISSVKYALVVKYDNVTLLGAGKHQSVIVRTDEHVNGHWTLFLAGVAKNAASMATADISTHDFNVGHANYTLYTMTAAAAGAGAITLATPAHAGNVAAGDFICIRTGQTLDVANQTNPDAEINRVVSANAGTGVIALQYPLTKTYAQEYFPDSGMNDSTSTTPSAWPAKFGVINANADVIENVRVEGLHFEGSASTTNGTCISIVQAFKPQIVGCTGDLTNYSFQSNGSWRFLDIDDCHVDQTLNLATADSVSGDKCCTDLLVSASRFTSRGAYHTRVHMNEGTANIAFSDTDFAATESTDLSQGLLFATARGYNFSFAGGSFRSTAGHTLASFSEINGIILNGVDFSCGEDIALAFADCSNVVRGVNHYGDASIAEHTNSATGSVTGPFQFYHALMLVQEYGVWDKLLFGTDYPFTTVNSTIVAPPGATETGYWRITRFFGSQ